MIALLAEDTGICKAVVSGMELRHVLRTTDGPFRLWRAKTTDLEQECLVLAAGSDMRRQYAAAALAIRRGAEKLIHLGTARRMLEGLPVTLKAGVCRLGVIVDASAYREAQLVTPDLSREQPPRLTCREYDISDAELRCATFPLPLTVSGWGRVFVEEELAHVTDQSVLGALIRAREERVDLMGWKLVRDTIQPRHLMIPSAPADRMAEERMWSQWASSEEGRSLSGNGPAASAREGDQ